MSLDNRWMRAAVPALLIHCSIGTVYCWSTFKASVAESIGMSSFSVGWAFSLAIFFLGMSAAFAGRLVEKNIHRSSLLSCLFFTSGMIGTGLCLQFLKGIPALIGIYICYGCVMGIGLGIGYLTPVKTLMLWFAKQKGLATGISIMGFGLAKAIATPLMEYFQSRYGIAEMFYILGAIYFIMMFAGHMLIRKPSHWVEPIAYSKLHGTRDMFSSSVFLSIWLMFYINIHCGLALITYEKQILNSVFAGVSCLAVIISVVPSVTAAFNALGRLGYSAYSDHLRDRNTVYKIIFFSSALVTLIGVLTQAASDGSGSLLLGALIILLLIVINAGYGGGFSTLPALLASRFGMQQISRLHGLALSAWAVAGLTGNNMSELILACTDGNYDAVLLATTIMYAVAMIVSIRISR
ncbi:MAG: MFS transporter [Desulfovibrionaceae bacterium]|nr:MFS transporter [Desulfovibrionaceae bacterium]